MNKKPRELLRKSHAHPAETTYNRKKMKQRNTVANELDKFTPVNMRIKNWGTNEEIDE